MTPVLVLRVFIAVLFLTGALASAAEKFVLTGPPGAGKTSIIEELAKQGYATFPEAYQTKYAKALEEGKPDIPFSDTQGFQNSLVELQLQWEANLKLGNFPVFFDRGTVDALGYFKIYNSQMTKENLKGCLENQYRAAFFIEALPEPFFQQTHIRLETYNEAQEKGRALLQEYQNEKNGLQVILVPSIDENQKVFSVKERTRIILEQVEKMLEDGSSK